MTELKDAKRLIAYARRAGVKSFRWGSLEVEFHVPGVIPPRQRGSIDASAQVSAGKNINPAPDPAPTLDQINAYIYGKADEPHEPSESH